MTMSASGQSYAPKQGWVNCFYKTYKGKRLGPYYVRRWKSDGKLYKQYIKPQDVEHVRAECQSYRQSQKEFRESSRLCDRETANFDFLGKMLLRYDTGKIVTAAMEAYIVRIYHEGLQITGRPPMRRKIIRRKLKINGKTLTRNTLFELGGIKNPFMVPLLTKRKEKTSKSLANQFMAIAKSAWGAVHGPTDHRSLSVSEIPDRRTSVESGLITDY